MDGADRVANPVRIGEKVDISGDLEDSLGAAVALAGQPTYRILKPDLATPVVSGNTDGSDITVVGTITGKKSWDTTGITETGDYMGEVTIAGDTADGRHHTRVTRTVIPVRA